MHKSPLFYNAQHSPLGSFASFTLGSRGAKGGLGLELGKPADQSVFIGREDEKGAVYFPFFENRSQERDRFEASIHGEQSIKPVRVFPSHDIKRELTPGRDVWQGQGLKFTIFTPVMSAPDPSRASVSQLKLAYVPALAAELVAENKEDVPRRIFFGFEGNDPRGAMRGISGPGKLKGIAWSDSMAIASDMSEVLPAQGFTAEDISSETNRFNYGFALGNVGLLIGTIPPKTTMTFKFVICFFCQGLATNGLPSNYLYNRYFRSLEDVASYALGHFDALKKRGDAFDKVFKQSRMSKTRKFMLAQAIHSYYGSTQLLDVKGEPCWVVNEGEYRMMNTLDLTADHLFFEMKMNPWTVGNNLDWYLRRYSYVDKLRLPNSPREYPGGLTFTHDMGVANNFSPAHHSSYERAGVSGCFSHMAHEELTNWLFCALVYARNDENKLWARKHLGVFRKILKSLLNRDHPEPTKRDGIMSLDTARCSGGAEITTYDSLDISLGQARNNVYLAVKTWGCYVGLAYYFSQFKDEKSARIAKTQAELAAKTIVASVDKKGRLPAILNENVSSRILPAVEGLIIPYALGLHGATQEDGPFGELISVLKTHFVSVLKPGVCLYPGGAWKISSTSDNSWLSKIYLIQFIAENILCCVPKTQTKVADEQHLGWLLEETNSYWAWSDQVINGVVRASKYYPRGVTAILWMDRAADNIRGSKRPGSSRASVEGINGSLRWLPKSSRPLVPQLLEDHRSNGCPA